MSESNGGPPMDSYESWIAAMPVEGVRQRIADLESELEVLRVLERRAREHAPAAESTPRRAATVTGVRAAQGRPPTGQLSPQRRAIIEVIRDHPNGMSPQEVAKKLRAQGHEVGDNAVQTNMSRMERRGMLMRVEQGRYRLPTHIPAATLLDGTPEGNGEVEEP